MEDILIENSGLTLSEYCDKMNDSPSAVWRKIKSGELVSRTVEGRLKIFDDSHVGFISPRPFGATSKDRGPASDLPDLPEIYSADEDQSKAMVVNSGYVSVIENSDKSQEVSLLIDHLSLAKEENKEILNLTQSSIRKITEMSEHLLESKEQIIDAHKQTIHEKNLLIEMLQEKLQNTKTSAAQTPSRKKLQKDLEKRMSDQKSTYEKRIKEKDEKIDLLSESISRLSTDLQKLRQDYEDLDILARALASQPSQMNR